MQRDLRAGDPPTLRALIYEAPAVGDPPATRPRARFNTFKWLHFLCGPSLLLGCGGQATNALDQHSSRRETLFGARNLAMPALFPWKVVHAV